MFKNLWCIWARSHTPNVHANILLFFSLPTSPGGLPAHRTKSPGANWADEDLLAKGFPGNRNEAEPGFKELDTQAVCVSVCVCVCVCVLCIPTLIKCASETLQEWWSRRANSFLMPKPSALPPKVQSFKSCSGKGGKYLDTILKALFAQQEPSFFYQLRDFA